MRKNEILTGIKDALTKVVEYIDELDELNDDYNIPDPTDALDGIETVIRNTQYYDEELKASIDAVSEEIQNVVSTSYDIADEIVNFRESIEYTLRDIDDFITVTRIRNSDDHTYKANIKHASICCISRPDDSKTHILFDNGITISVIETPEKIFELIEKAKRTEYQKYLDTIAENGLTEDEIRCYMAYQQPDLICPDMSMEETLSKIDEVKKAKAEGFDFSIEKLLDERDKLYY